MLRSEGVEVVLVDDGSPEPFKNRWDFVKVVRLPLKFRPLNPCVPINVGVEEASGDLIALSNPEILHPKPILKDMAASIKKDNDYVIAGVWSEEQNRWHCHSSIDRGKYLPKGSDYHFMTMMNRTLWDRTGGFDEEYRQGAGYDDPDFVRRLYRAGANFIRRDDLVVEHPRKDAHANWTPQMFERNKNLFLSKWGPL